MALGHEDDTGLGTGASLFYFILFLGFLGGFVFFTAFPFGLLMLRVGGCRTPDRELRGRLVGCLRV